MQAHGKYKCTMQAATGRKSIYVHKLVAEAALGKPIPSGSPVHHVDGNRGNNNQSNLVICEDKAYHMLLHKRTDVYEAGGDPNLDKICTGCKNVQALSNFSSNRTRVDGVNNLCKPCDNAKNKERYMRRNVSTYL